MQMGGFYQFLEMVPKASQNFYFVLNKADLLFRGESLETGYERLAGVSARFQEYIKGNSISEPVLFAISAQNIPESGQLPPWNQLMALRREIFQQRDIKQITTIKARNLDVEVQKLINSLQKEVRNLGVF